jgi:hypothetical protein
LPGSSLVAVPKRDWANGQRSGCVVCAMGDDVMQEVNAAIWTPERIRTKSYRRNGLRVLQAHGRKPDVKSITRHALHVEQSWRVAAEPTPAERPVFPIDYGSTIDRFVTVSHQALDQLEFRMGAGAVKDGDLVAISKLGLGATVARQRHEDAGRQQPIALIALMGVAMEALDTPEGEIKDVTPIDDLKAEWREERAALMLNAGYEVE